MTFYNWEWIDDTGIENKALGKYFKRRKCTLCDCVEYEETDHNGKVLTNYIEQHYKERHCDDNEKDCSCDKQNSCNKSKCSSGCCLKVNTNKTWTFKTGINIFRILGE